MVAQPCSRPGKKGSQGVGLIFQMQIMNLTLYLESLQLSQFVD
jgi:hypothetical protein